MLFKVLLLVAVCSTLVASKDLHQKDTLTAKAHEAQDLKKDFKRDDETAKKSAVAESPLDDAGIEIGGEPVKVFMTSGDKVPKKRHVEIDHQDQKECCG